MDLQGKYGEAKVYADIIDGASISQILNMLNQPFTKDSKIAIMPDVHAGAGCTIGTTMTIQDKIVPNLVGVDIGCGVTMVELLWGNYKGGNVCANEIDDEWLRHIDNTIRECIPSGFNVRDHKWRKEHGAQTGDTFLNKNNLFTTSDIRSLRCNDKSIDRIIDSIGTLGGGNHYIEIGKDSNGKLWLSVHSGSRYLGTCVAKYYQKLAIQEIKKSKEESLKQKIEEIRKTYAKEPPMIEKKIKELVEESKRSVPDALCWLDRNFDSVFDDYLHDMEIVQRYAALNRIAIIKSITSVMGLKIGETIEAIHNYIDLKNMILRKGAVSAQKDEILVIPMNMRDGALICKGKGNPEWNYSAPHGAGRLMSRSTASSTIQLEDFQESMKGIYSTSIKHSTIDESPMAYKPIDVIKENIKDTVEIIDTVSPIYNFKAS